MSFTNEERLFINHIRNTVAPFFPYDFDYSDKENLIEAVKYYKDKGYLPSLRTAPKARETYGLILVKLGVEVPTQEEILRKHRIKKDEALIRLSNEAYDKKIAALERSLEKTKQMKIDAAQEFTKKLEAEIQTLEDKKAELKQRLIDAQTAEERVALEKEKIRAQEEIEKEFEEKLIGKDTYRKCWNCGEWFPVAGGVHTKHLKVCKPIETETDGE